MNSIFNVYTDGGAYEIKLDVDLIVLRSSGGNFYTLWFLLSGKMPEPVFNTIHI